ncbi:MAG: hypothetical protein WD073_09940 [Xanthobacteraceae bacterium]
MHRFLSKLLILPGSASAKVVLGLLAAVAVAWSGIILHAVGMR